MSADNYILVRQDQYKQWCFTDENASTLPSPVPDSITKYQNKIDAVEAAERYCQENIVEYGIRIEPDSSKKRPEQESIEIVTRDVLEISEELASIIRDGFDNWVRIGAVAESLMYQAFKVVRIAERIRLKEDE